MLDTGKYNDICKYEMQWCIGYMIPYDTYCHIIWGTYDTQQWIMARHEMQ